MSHPKLLHKLQAIGIGGKLLSWISSFLSSRFQSTVVGATRSPLIKMSSGVPQGSVLGPLLFVLYVNEIAELLKPCLSLKMFADDIKLYSSLKSSSDILEFQRSLDKLFQWSIAYLLEQMLYILPRFRSA